MIDIFEYKNNFAKYANVKSKLLFGDLGRKIPKYTVVIPTYNRSDKLKIALESAISQVADESYDILVLDNDNTDNSKTQLLLKDYCAKYDNIYYYKNEQNIGMFGNWNRCYELARTEWCCMLNDDDQLLNKYIDAVNTALLNNNCDGIHVESILINVKCEKSAKKSIKKSIAEWLDAKYFNKRPTTESIELPWFKLETALPPCGTALRRTAVLDIGGYNDELYPSADWAFSACFSCRYRLKLLHEQLVKYNCEDNYSSKKSVQIGWIEKDYQIKLSIYKKLGKRHYCLIIGDLWRRMRLYGIQRTELINDFFPNTICCNLSTFMIRLRYFLNRIIRAL